MDVYDRVRRFRVRRRDPFPQAQLCAEMAELLPTKIDNLRRLEADDASAVDPLLHALK